MARRVVFTHLTGTKASTTQEFEVGSFQALTFGREPSCEIRYDKDRDDLVSRRHMKLVLADAETAEFTVVDLNSRNGVFVNKQRVIGSMKINPGDVVQIGAGGPQFIFDVEPRNKELPVTTLLPVFTRDMATGPDTTADEAARDDVRPEEKPAVLPRHPRRKRWKRSRLIAALALAATTAGIFLSYRYAVVPPNIHAIAGIAVAWTKAGIEQASAAATHASRYVGAIPQLLRRSPEIPASAAADTKQLESVAAIETGWTLIDSATGRELQQVYLGNETTGPDGDRRALVTGAGRDLPVFVLVDGNRLQPMLTFAQTGSYRRIGRKFRGWGFLVSPEGIILTNRHIAEPWHVPYEWPAEDQAGIVAILDASLQVAQTGVIARRMFPKWVPTDAGFVLERSFVPGPGGLSNRPIRATGKTHELNVVFGRGSVPLPAHFIWSSGNADLAAIGIDGRVPMRELPIAADSDCKPGDVVQVVTASDRSATIRPGRVAGRTGEQQASAAAQCEVDLRVESVGMIGAPVLDEHGRAIAVQTAGDPLQPATVVAVPIRYGRELIGEPAVSRP